MAGLMLRTPEAEAVGKGGNVLIDLSSVEITPRSLYCATPRTEDVRRKKRRRFGRDDDFLIVAPVEIFGRRCGA
jgi:hypothetical protein